MDAKDLFQALEFAHYAERFRDKVFAIALPEETPFQELLLDIKVLVGYRIQVVLVVPDPDFQLENLIQVSNHRGTRFHLSLVTEAMYDPAADRLEFDLDRLRAVLRQGKTPIIAYHPGVVDPPPDEGAIAATYTLAGEVAVRMGADKLFLVGDAAARLRESEAGAHFTVGDLPRLRAALPGKGLLEYDALLAFVEELLARGIPDIVLMEGRPAHLFREVFTLDGAGILVNRGQRTEIRQARVKDTTDIALLIKPEIEAGRILEVGEANIEAHIDSYWVYEVDGLLVGAARFKNYGPCAELAQFSTLPRYRGKGRAKELALRMIEEARGNDKDALFALSVDPRMWGFFLSLGFQETEREALPAGWQAQYDFSRPSRGFLMELQ